jgi:hypothetical protein
MQHAAVSAVDQYPVTFVKAFGCLSLSAIQAQGRRRYNKQ